ncbi:MAG: hypothetical protein QFX40_03170 [Archaeoglobales archaeon]|nr:hypothetical protein [Archaeoglobales archaeon]
MIYLAAQFSVEKSFKDLFFDLENRLIAILNLLRSNLEFIVEKFFYFSSAAVHGNPVYLPISDEVAMRGDVRSSSLLGFSNFMNPEF